MKHDEEASNSEAWRTNALLEDVNAKFDAVLEAVKPIPQMQEDIRELKNRVETVQEDVAIVKESVRQMSPTLDATFEQVGTLSVDMETVKDALQKQQQDQVETKHRLNTLERK